MEITTFALVLLSACIQASWNFIAKRSNANRAVLILFGWFLVGIVFLPVSLFLVDLSQFSPKWIHFIFFSSLIHIVYIILLSWGYSAGEISVVYPVSRGFGIAGTSILSSVFGTSLAPLGIVGISLIAGGTSFIGLKELKPETRTAFLIALAIGSVVAVYSYVDSLAVKVVPPLVFLASVNFLPALLAAPYVLTRYRKDFDKIRRENLRECLVVAIGGSGAYLLILYAYQHTAAPYVVALREFSVVIASLLGIYVLKERLHFTKIIAIILIVAGIIFLKML